MVQKITNKVSNVPSSGYDAVVGINDYDPEKEQGQIGKSVEEEVAKENNWIDDKHDVTGLPMPKEIKAMTIQKLKDVIAKIAEFDEPNEEIIEDLKEDIQDLKEDLESLNDEQEDDEESEEDDLSLFGENEDVENKISIKEDEQDMVKELKEASVLLKKAADLLDNLDKRATKKVALHPSEARDESAYENAVGSPQMGDDTWVDIGPATFKDLRDEVGKAK